VILENRFRLFDLLFMQRQQTLSAAALKRPFAIGSIRQEISQRGQQKRTEPAFLPIDALVDFVFDQVGKKALREILRVVHGVSAAAHETVERRPIGLAKLRERCVRNLWFGLTSPRRENHTPVGRRKQIALAIPIPYQRLHLSSLYQERKKKASRKKNLNFVQHALWNPFVQGRKR
jgi:hypothetical protein